MMEMMAGQIWMLLQMMNIILTKESLQNKQKNLTKKL